jgi:hypothetical protein
MIRLSHTGAFLLFAGILSHSILAQEEPGRGPTLPFRVEYRIKSFPDAPPLVGLQAYSATMIDGKILILGGRKQGLHYFKSLPEQNMPPENTNNLILVIDPASGKSWSYDVTALPQRLGDAIRSNNQQSWYDRQSDQWYILGGYGWDRATSDMRTFPTMLRVSGRRLIAELMAPNPNTNEAIEKLFELHEDERFAVTGGGLHRLDNNFYLVLGQRFDGQYSVFDPGTQRVAVRFKQKYTEEIRVFTLKPGTLQILSYGQLDSDDPTKPLHRRDGPILGTVDPSTGEPRIAAFGGVFVPGTTQGYTAPIYIYDGSDQPYYTIDTQVQQHFSQYECPVLPIFDAESKAIYHIFFGGISHYFYGFDEMQMKVYQKVTEDKRADGVPFIGNVSGMVQRADGSYDQFILPDSLPRIAIPDDVKAIYFKDFRDYEVDTTNLYASSVEMIENSEAIDQGFLSESGVVDLERMAPGQTIVAGYIYGGIASVFPYALRPSQGTFPSNHLLEVTITRAFSQALPGSDGIPAEVTTQTPGR